MKNTLCTLLLLIFCFIIQPLHAQNFLWAKSSGANTDDVSFSVFADAAGNVYNTGYFKGTVDFDPGPNVTNLTSAGNTDVYVQKLDANGNFLWVRSFGSTSFDGGYSVVVDAAGNVYSTGCFTGTVDFDPGPNVSNFTGLPGGTDVYVHKMDANGNFLWAKTFGGSSNDCGYELVVDASGNIYTTGYYSGSGDFDPGPNVTTLTSAGDLDFFVHKLNASGNLVWVKSFGDINADTGFSIALDGSGNVYTAGNYQGSVDFDPGPGTLILTSLGIFDNFVQKLDPSGNLVWARSYGGNSYDYCYSVKVDANGNVFSTGSFEGTADFDPGNGVSNLTSGGNSDTYVQKLDAAGNFLWAKSFGNAYYDNGHCLALDAAGNVYTTGNFYSTVDFDPGPATFNLTVAGIYDGYIHKLDAGGNFVTAMSIGGSTTDLPYSIYVDGSGNIHCSGEFGGTADFDPGPDNSNLTSNGLFDIFVLKIGQCIPNSGVDSHIACNNFTWIDSITYTSSNNTATYLLTNQGGCDSLVTLNLIINNVSNITTSVTGITITANNAFATYQWLDCNNNFAIIPGATNQAYTPMANGSYAVKLTENGCTDTSACVNMANVGLNDQHVTAQFNASPNPTNGKFSLDFDRELKDFTIVIRNIMGQEISRKYYAAAAFVDMQIEGPEGIYFVEIRNQNLNAVLKVTRN